jgi:hypothetical protein
VHFTVNLFKTCVILGSEGQATERFVRFLGFGNVLYLCEMNEVLNISSKFQETEEILHLTL